MNILFLIPSLHARGAERVLVSLVRSLDLSHYQITVQTLFDVGPLRYELPSDVEYRRGLPFIFRGNVQLMKLFSPAWLYRIIVGRRYDVVVAFLEGAVTRIISGCPYPDTRRLAWVHIEQHDLPTFAHCYRSASEAIRCYQRFDQVIAVSQSVKQGFDAMSGFSARVIHNLIDVDRILQLSREQVTDFTLSACPNLISVGSLTHQKGYDRLIRVHCQLLQRGLLHHVYVIGEGESEASLRNLIRELDVDETFHLLGYRSNPYPYLTQADLYVCSSRQEGMSTAVTEALILGLPVISTRCGGAEELLGASGEYGVVTSNDEQGLFSGLSHLLGDTQCLLDLRSKASLRSDVFSPKPVLQSLSGLFDP